MRDKGSYQWLSKYYDLIDWPCEYFFYNQMRNFYLTKLKNQKILEIGVGTGKNLPFYHSSNTVIGIDRIPEMLFYAKQRKNTSHLLKVESPPYDLNNNSIDIVIATFTLYTTNQASSIVDEITRVIKKNGNVIIFEYRRPRNRFLYYLLVAFSPFFEKVFGVNFTKIRTPKLFDDKYVVIHYREWIPQLLYAIILKYKGNKIDKW